MFEQIAAAYPRLVTLLQRTCGLSRIDAVGCIMAQRYGARHPFRADPCGTIRVAIKRRAYVRTLKVEG